MWKMKTIVCVVMVLTATNASAQTTSETPDAVARQVIGAMRTQDWAKYAGLMHKEALANLKRGFGALISTKGTEDVRRLFFEVNSQAEYERLPETEVFVRLMRGLTKQVPQMSEAYNTSEITVLGSVAESPELSHVVYRFRWKMEGVPLTKMAIFSLKKDGTEWRALLTGDLEAIVAAALKGASKQPASVSR